MNAYRCLTQAAVEPRENKKSLKRNVAVRPAEVGANSVQLVPSPEVVKEKKLRVNNNVTYTPVFPDFLCVADQS